MAKVGRPKIDENKKKTMRLAVRVSMEEYQRVIAYAQAHNQTITQVLQAGFKKLEESQ